MSCLNSTSQPFLRRHSWASTHWPVGSTSISPGPPKFCYSSDQLQAAIESQSILDRKRFRNAPLSREVELLESLPPSLILLPFLGRPLEVTDLNSFWTKFRDSHRRWTASSSQIHSVRI